jgi:hypothetical protein
MHRRRPGTALGGPGAGGAACAALPCLRQHVEQGCPLGFGDTTNVRVEPRVSALDSHANVVVAATPDLTFTAGDRYVWRETKTTGRALPADEVSALQSFLSCAVDLLLLHDQVPEGGDHTLIRREGVVELEVLRAEDSRVYILDTADAELVAFARQVVPAPHSGGTGTRHSSRRPEHSVGGAPCSAGVPRATPGRRARVLVVRWTTR